MPEHVLSVLHFPFYLISKSLWGGYQSHFGLEETETHRTLINGSILASYRLSAPSPCSSPYDIVVSGDPLKVFTSVVRAQWFSNMVWHGLKNKHYKGKGTQHQDQQARDMASPVVSSSLYREAHQLRKSAPSSMGFIPAEGPVGSVFIHMRRELP